MRTEPAARTGPAARVAVALACAALAGWLGACASSPATPANDPQPPTPDRPVAVPDARVAAFEHSLRARALQAERQGRLGDAALAWETLAALRPDAEDVLRQWADTRRLIEAAIATRLPQAAAARQRGDLDGAARRYLEVLALAPHHGAAADALREIERERNKRSVLGRHSRQLLRAGEVETAPAARPAAPRPPAAAARTLNPPTASPSGPGAKAPEPAKPKP